VVTVAQGEIWWASLPEPTGSGPGYRRPVVIVQGDHLNRSKLQTIVCVPLTSNLAWAEAPGNVLLTTRDTGLPKDSVANASQLVAVDRELLTERCGRLSARNLWLVLSGIDVVLGR
jgi:mRNA interferase MazF